MIKIKITHEKLDSVPRLKELAVDGSIKGAGIDSQGDETIYTVSDSKLSLALALEIQSLGGEVYDIPLFIEIAKKTDKVPIGLKGSLVQVDDESASENRTWEAWKRSTHTFIERGGKIFIGTNAFTGKYLPLGELDAVSDKLVHIDDLPVEEITKE